MVLVFMYELTQARISVLEHLEAMKACDPQGSAFELVLVDEATQEHDFGWVFFYTTKDAREAWRSFAPEPPSSPEDMIGGNAPLIFERATGAILTTGTALPLDHYLQNYFATGDPHRALGSTVRILGWKEVDWKVSSTKAIRDASGLSLRDAKRCVDRSLDGQQVDIECESLEDAEWLVAALTEFGWRVQRLPE